MRPQASRASSPNPTANLVGSRRAGRANAANHSRRLSFLRLRRSATAARFVGVRAVVTGLPTPPGVVPVAVLVPLPDQRAVAAGTADAGVDDIVVMPTEEGFRGRHLNGQDQDDARRDGQHFSGHSYPLSSRHPARPYGRKRASPSLGIPSV